MSWCCFLTLQVLAHSERLRGLLCTTVLSKGTETLFCSSGSINSSNGLLCIILNVKADTCTVTEIIYTYHKERSMSGWLHLNTRSLTWTKNNSLGIRIGAMTNEYHYTVIYNDTPSHCWLPLLHSRKVLPITLCKFAKFSLHFNLSMNSIFLHFVISLLVWIDIK